VDMTISLCQCLIQLLGVTRIFYLLHIKAQGCHPGDSQEACYGT